MCELIHQKLLRSVDEVVSGGSSSEPEGGGGGLLHNRRQISEFLVGLL